MFSGIVEELGELKKVSRRGNATLFEVNAHKVIDDVDAGASISVNGVCLTIVKKTTDVLSFEVMPQTLKVTNLGVLRMKDKVNLERALKIGERLSGHFVTGHVDTIGVIRRKGYISGNLCFEVAVPGKFMEYCLQRGSIAVDGISLTIVDKKPASFTVYIIPHTLKETTLSFKGASDKVNVEFDILAKRPSV
jgi:riboflavin synthase